MELEKQVVSLELSKELKSLGFKQKSLWYWVEHIYGDNPQSWPGDRKPGNYFYIKLGKPSGCYCDGVYQGQERFYSAYTVAELGEMLPKYTNSGKSTDERDYRCWHCLKNIDQFADTEANARAKMLIYLKENNLLRAV